MEKEITEADCKLLEGYKELLNMLKQENRPTIVTYATARKMLSLVPKATLTYLEISLNEHSTISFEWSLDGTSNIAHLEIGSFEVSAYVRRKDNPEPAYFKFASHSTKQYRDFFTTLIKAFV